MHLGFLFASHCFAAEQTLEQCASEVHLSRAVRGVEPLASEDGSKQNILFLL